MMIFNKLSTTLSADAINPKIMMLSIIQVGTVLCGISLEDENLQSIASKIS